MGSSISHGGFVVCVWVASFAELLFSLPLIVSIMAEVAGAVSNGEPLANGANGTLLNGTSTDKHNGSTKDNVIVVGTVPNKYPSGALTGCT